MPHVIAEPCVNVKDKACVDVCPVEAIGGNDSEPQYYINPDVCIDCGACASTCPVEAIFPEDELPEAWLGYREKNANFYK